MRNPRNPRNHGTPPNTITIRGPIFGRTPSRGKFGTTWWGARWMETLERYGDEDALDQRLARGRTYARNGAIHRMDISAGLVTARVYGSSTYNTTLHLRTFNDAEWGAVLHALGMEVIFTAKLLAGEMPKDIDAVFSSQGLSLFPEVDDPYDLRFDCSCPDWAVPCKHAAAVCCILAEQIDADPFLVLHLRGRTRSQVLTTLLQSDKQSAVSPVAEPTSELSADGFWEVGPPLPSIPPPGPFAPAVWQFGPPPREIADPKALERIYISVARVAATRLAARRPIPSHKTRTDD